MNYACLCLAAFLLCTGCSDAPHSYWEVNPQADFKPLKTYSFEKNEQLLLTAREKLLGIPLRSMIEKSIESQLASKGFARAATGDFVVRYRITVEQKADDGTRGGTREDVRQTVAEGENPYVPMDPGTSRQSVDATREGTLVIEIIDAKTSKGLWRGTHERAILDKASDEERKARLDNGIATLLKRFPPN